MKKKSSATQSEKIEEYNEHVNYELIHIPLDSIKERVNGNTREIDDVNVENLMSSIRNSGFTSTISIDKNRALIAGEHRRVALSRLRESGWAGITNEGFKVDYDRIPCSLIPIDSAVDRFSALRHEISENFIRKNFTEADIFRAIDAIEKEGYQYKGHSAKNDEMTQNQVLQKWLNVSPSFATRWLKKHRLKKNGITLHDVVLPDDASADLSKNVEKKKVPTMPSKAYKRFVEEDDFEVERGSPSSGQSVILVEQVIHHDPVVVEVDAQEVPETEPLSNDEIDHRSLNPKVPLTPDQKICKTVNVAIKVLSNLEGKLKKAEGKTRDKEPDTLWADLWSMIRTLEVYSKALN